MKTENTTETTETTPEDFELFKAECRRWIEFWGLYDWRVVYEHAELDDSNGQCKYSIPSKIAVIKLSTKIPKDTYSPLEIKRIAFHEVDELRFGTAQSIAMSRYTSDAEIDAAFHGVIRQDENKIFFNPALNPAITEDQ